MSTVHGWTLISINAEWNDGNILITLKNRESEMVHIFAEGFSDLHVPKRNAWGDSDSVNEVSEIELLSNGNHHIMIEMQSGDILSIEATRIQLPI